MLELVLGSLFLVGVIALSMQRKQERLYSLVPGTLVTVYAGVAEMVEALAPNVDAREQAMSLATSIAFTIAAALLVRLIIRKIKAGTVSNQAVS